MKDAVALGCGALLIGHAKLPEMDEGEASGDVSVKSKQDGTNCSSDVDLRYLVFGSSNVFIEEN